MMQRFDRDGMYHVAGLFVAFNDVEELQTELDAYKAHVALLGGFITKVRSENRKRQGWDINPDDGFCSEIAQDCTKILAKTPAQSLGDVRAEAVLDMVVAVKVTAMYGSDVQGTINVGDALSYANKLKEGN